jgi:hypothetical protein
MNFDEEDDDDDEVSSSSSQLNSNTRPGSATSKKSCKVYKTQSMHLAIWQQHNGFAGALTISIVYFDK